MKARIDPNIGQKSEIVLLTRRAPLCYARHGLPDRPLLAIKRDERTPRATGTMMQNMIFKVGLLLGAAEAGAVRGCGASFAAAIRIRGYAVLTAAPAFGDVQGTSVPTRRRCPM
jgi:hypothetical protein